MCKDSGLKAPGFGKCVEQCGSFGSFCAPESKIRSPEPVSTSPLQFESRGPYATWLAQHFSQIAKVCRTCHQPQAT